MGTPTVAQSGLSSRLDQAEQQLSQDEQTCREVNLAEYAQLLQEASKNKQRAEKAKKKGVPVDEAQVAADLGKAGMLFARAQAAQARHCMMQAQQQPQSRTGTEAASTPSDFYANPRPEARRPQVVQQGTRFPAVCSYETLTTALDRATSTQGAESCFARAILERHNAERAAVGVPPLKWNPELAQHATEYAQVLAQTGQLVHASREGRGIERENLQKGLIGWSPDQMLQEWLGEKRLFHAGTFPDVCEGDWTQCAHYSQVIWPTTTDLGCGEAQGLGFEWFVCRYSPGGNRDGKPVGLAWNGGDVTVSVTPVFFTAGRTATTTTINMSGAQDVKGRAPPPPPPPPTVGFVFDTPGRSGGNYIGGDFGAMIAEGATGDLVIDAEFDGPITGGFLILSNSVDADGNVESVTFYDPAFAAAPVYPVTDSYSPDTGSWRRGVRVGSNLSDSVDSWNILFDDVGVVDFSAEPEPTSKVEQPKLPPTEVFTPPTLPVKTDEKATAPDPSSLKIRINYASGRLHSQLDHAGPIDVVYYTSLADEAHRQWDETARMVEKAKRAGLPIDPVTAGDVEYLERATAIAGMAKAAAQTKGEAPKR